MEWKNLQDKIISLPNSQIPQGYLNQNDFIKYLTEKLYGRIFGIKHLWKNPSEFHVKKALSLVEEMEIAKLRIPKVKTGCLGLIELFWGDVGLCQCGTNEENFFWYIPTKKRNIYYRNFSNKEIVESLKRLIEN